MFTLFPGRRRKNVYLYTGVGGDDDLPKLPMTPTPSQPIQPKSSPSNEKLSNALVQNNRLQTQLDVQKNQIDTLQQEILTRTEAIDSLKKSVLVQCAECTTRVEKDIVALQLSLTQSKENLNKTAELYRHSQRDVNRLTRQFLELSETVSRSITGNTGNADSSKQIRGKSI